MVKKCPQEKLPMQLPTECSLRKFKDRSVWLQKDLSNKEVV